MRFRQILTLCLFICVGAVLAIFATVHSAQAMSVYDVKIFPDLSVGRPNTTIFPFPSALAPSGGGTLTATAFGDLDGPGEDVEVFAETVSGVSLGILFDIPGCGECGDARTDTIPISESLLQDFATDTVINFAFVIHPDNGASRVRYQSLNLIYPCLSDSCQIQSIGVGVSVVPLPGALPLLLSALAGLWGVMRWRRS